MTKLVILAAGFGSRMGLLGDSFNKALLPIQGKAVISHIIENAPVDHIIIAIGYRGQQIKDYCSIFHQKNNITFIEVDNYDGPGAGPGYSMFCCKAELNCPFYLVTVDSLLTQKLPAIDCNWIGSGDVDDMRHYSTLKVDENDIVVDFQNKNENSLPLAFTGVIAVKDYDLFWKRYEQYLNEKPDKEIEFVGAFYRPFFAPIKNKKIAWKDVGRRTLYMSVYESLDGVDDYDLKKVDHDELTYIYDGKVAKLSMPKIITQKKLRQRILHDFTPEPIHDNLHNLLVHNFICGKNLYQIGDAEVYHKFLKWADDNLFCKTIECNKGFKEACEKFYKQKTYERIAAFYKRFPEFNSELIIASTTCGNAFDYFNKIDWNFICEESKAYIFHGDLNFGNIILQTNGDFKLIDWRSDFAGLPYGDLYYDFAKLYAGCLINFYKCCYDKRYFYKKQSKEYDVNWFSTADEQIFIHHFRNWLVKNNFSLDKVELLSYLILLNMAPLHLENFSKYLYLQGIRYLEIHFQKK
jgi:hypothetical protein